MGQYLDAIADYTQVLRLRPNDAEAYYNRGYAKENLGQYEAAIADYDQALQIKPDYAKVYSNRGAAKCNLGRTAEAKQDFQTALILAQQSEDTDFKISIKRILQVLE